ncbi:MAG: hypothetical protein SGILL_000354 [Bacillariaceae sp.]
MKTRQQSESPEGNEGQNPVEAGDKPRAVVVTPKKKFPAALVSEVPISVEEIQESGKELRHHEPSAELKSAPVSPASSVLSRAEATGRSYRAKYDPQHQQRQTRASNPVLRKNTHTVYSASNPIMSASPSHPKQSPSSVGRSQRHSVGGGPYIPPNQASSTYPRPSNDGSMYKNILKPVRRDRGGPSTPTRKAAYGGVIETPKSVKVSSLRASFDSRQNNPIMPMNSSDPRVRHSLPLSSVNHSKNPNKYDAMKASSSAASLDRQQPKGKLTDDPETHHPQEEEIDDEPQESQPRHDISSTCSIPGTAVSSLSPSTRNGPSSPSRGVADKYRVSTGRTVVDNEEEFMVENTVEAPTRETSQDSSSHKVQKYYQASWRVQTNDFETETSQQNNDAQSPRQTVLSSWNQKFHEKQMVDSQGTARQYPKKIPEHSSQSDAAVNESSYSNGPECQTHQHVPVAPVVLACHRSEEQHRGGFSQTTSQSVYQRHDQKQSEIIQTSTPKKKVGAKSTALLSTWRQWEDSNKTPSRSFDDKPLLMSLPKKEGATVELENTLFVQHDVALDGAESQESNLSSTEKEFADPCTGGSDLSSSSDPFLEVDSKIVPEQNDKSTYGEAGQYLSDGIQEISQGPEASPSYPQIVPRSTPTKQPTLSKPWEKDFNNSLLQSRQTRSPHLMEPEVGETDATQTQANESSVEVDKKASTQPNPSLNSQRDLPENFDFLEERKSDDLSIDENRIFGVEEAKVQPTRERIESDSGRHLDAYDDDSYISATGSGSGRMKPLNDVGDLEQVDSEEISLYVEDETTNQQDTAIIDQAVEKMAPFVVPSNPAKEARSDHQNISEPPTPTTKNLLRINPSPKDNTKYRIGYFGDESPVAVRGADTARNEGDSNKKVEGTDRAKINTKTAKTAATTNSVDIWKVSSVSDDEQDEDIQFDDTDDWMNRDPEVCVEEDIGEDNSISTEQDSVPQERFELPSKPPKAKESSGLEAPIPVLNNPNSWIPKDKKGKTNSTKRKPEDAKVAFNPFDDDTEEANRGENDNDALFSPNPDPFATEESFSPVNWSSPSPNGTTTGPQQQQGHIGYYNSPDSRLEI